jgi:hypothetical protein
LSPAEVEGVLAFRKALGERHELGRDLDGYTILLADARTTDLPHDQVFNAVDESWALHRAHVHAGRFHLVTGTDPRHIVPAPGWDEIVGGLDCEMTFIVQNPQHPQFGMLNLARLLYTWTTRDVVLSKCQAAEWALANLAPEWHPAVEAAVRDYARRPLPGDRALLERALPDFLGFAAERIASLRPR